MKAIIYLICLLPLSGSGQISWSHVSTLPDIPQSNFVSIVHDSILYVMEGIDSAYVEHDNVWQYNLNANTWSHNPMCGSFRYNGSAGVNIGQYIYLINGQDSNGHTTSRCSRYDLASDQCTQIASTPAPRVLSDAFTYQTRIFSCFGYENPSLRNNMWEYNISLDRWFVHAPIPSSGRETEAKVVIDSFAYFAGGFDTNVNSMNEFWRYNIIQDRWDSMPRIPGPGRSGALIYGFKNFLLVGYGAYFDRTRSVYDSVLSDMYMFDFTSNIWSPLITSGLVDTPMVSIGGFFMYNKKCYLYGGVRNTTNWSIYRDLWMFDPAPLGPVWDTLSTGVQEIARDIQGLRVYPVPVRDILHIDGDIQGMDISVTDMMGRHCAAPVSGRDIAVSSLPAGVYVLHVSDRGSTSVVRRFLIE